MLVSFRLTTPSSTTDFTLFRGYFFFIYFFKALRLTDTFSSSGDLSRGC